MQKCVKSADHIFIDRIDIQVEVESVPFEDMAKAPKGESSSVIRERVLNARRTQIERYKDIKGIHCNAQMNTAHLQKYVQLNEETATLLRNAMKKFNLSARAYDRILKVSRAIAALEGKENIEMHHVAEAVGYRRLDRGDWAER